MRGILSRAQHWALPLAIFAALTSAYLLGAFEPVGRALMDSRFQLLSRGTSGKLVVVAIDSRSLQALRTWPWPRAYHARLLDRLLAAGASEVALDIDFSSTSTPSDDDALAAALRRAGDRVILPAFAQRGTLSSRNGIGYSLPAPVFRSAARLAAVNVFPDQDSLIREYSPVVRFEGTPLPSAATVLFGGLPAQPGDFYLDYGIRLSDITSLSYADVLSGQFDPALIAGKKVVVGATAVELGDQFAVPLHRTMAGPVLQALAFESLSQGRALHRSGLLPTLGLAMLVLILLRRPLAERGWRRGSVALIATAAVLYVLALALQAAAPLSLDLAPALAGALALYAIGVLRELEQEARAALKHRMSDLHRRAMMQGVLEDSFDGIIIARADGRIELANGAASRLLGRTPQELAGQPVDQFLPGARALQEDVLAARDVAGEPGRPQRPVERQIAGPNGTAITIEHLASCSELRVAAHRSERRTAGRLVFIHTFRDISERKTAEEKLREAMHQAVAANRAKTEFLANMSHELRTPLNAILGFSEVIRDGVLEPVGRRSRDYAGDIHKSGEHLLSLIGDVLDLAKIETGRFDLREEKVVLSEVVSACVLLLEQRAKECGVRLRAAVAPQMPQIWADRLRLKQIVLNLTSNAVKFTPEGGTVTLSAGIAAGGAIEICVSDTGIGIEPQDVPVALEPFRQVESAFNRTHEGTGLGLPLAKSLTELHGGTLDIDSTPGQGTTVRVQLPAYRLLLKAA